MRRRLPNRRETESYLLPGGDYTVSVGRYEDGAAAEVFISSRKPTSDGAAHARDGAVLISLALQHGVPLEDLRGAITRLHDGSAATVIGAALDLIAGAGEVAEGAQ
jgi:hypothetical protein